jgi:hypothetical protein
MVPDRSRERIGAVRRLVLLVLATLLVMLVALGNSAAQAQTDEQSDESDVPVQVRDATDQNVPGLGIIPKPNSGAYPEDASDRGGALQFTLLGLIVLFPIAAFVAIRRQGRRAREARRQARTVSP